MTPIDKNCVALFRWGEWIEVYKGEALMAHPDYKHMLETHFMMECKGPVVYPTIKEALEARNNISMMKNTH